ncbi:unnamed protein product, partial [Discosporangium mesarthrocarpum]
LRLFLPKVPCPSNRPLFWELNPGDTLVEALKGKAVIEFPVVHVVAGEDAHLFPTLVREEPSCEKSSCKEQPSTSTNEPIKPGQGNSNNTRSSPPAVQGKIDLPSRQEKFEKQPSSSSQATVTAVQRGGVGHWGEKREG